MSCRKLFVKQQTTNGKPAGFLVVRTVNLMEPRIGACLLEKELERYVLSANEPNSKLVVTVT